MRIKKLLLSLAIIGVVISPIQVSATNTTKVSTVGNINKSFIEEVNKIYWKVPACVRAAFEYYGGNVYITDEDLGRKLNKRANTVLAYTEVNTWQIYIDNRENASQSVIHELGHMLDKYLGCTYESDEFTEIYNEEVKKFCKVHSTDKKNTSSMVEYFAEAFQVFVTNPDLLHDTCPKTFEFIKDYLRICTTIVISDCLGN